ncbi:LD-carboxypeptidase-domain-containing protein [Stachybotrys elegans]|uniref:LD-carboxypeptidase-domain-containing protein n=1 Tax=Stachybotrys elegans TaxID=80388 RepID=A0A8K0STW2_9HYPO|nr:LD-carboxypeptidase-domain-containing protein [Stachybotrys elegans]
MLAMAMMVLHIPAPSILVATLAICQNRIFRSRLPMLCYCIIRILRHRHMLNQPRTLSLATPGHRLLSNKGVLPQYKYLPPHPNPHIKPPSNMKPITPKALPPGGTIAFISPSARLNALFPDVFARATEALEARGYKVRTFFTEGKAGTQADITNRLAEIRAVFSDKEVDVVICTIGGTTFTELLPALIADTELHDVIRRDPKVVVGYSDISGFHWFLHAMTGLRTFYGPGAIPELGEPGSLDDEASPRAFCLTHLLRCITSPSPLGEIPRSLTYTPRESPFWKDPASTEPTPTAPTPPWTWLRRGKSQGRLFGGCLTVVARLQGIRAITPDWRGRIVFLETAMADGDDAGNPPERVQAAFADLIAGGVFEEAAGLVVGRPFGYDTEEQRKQYAGIITSLLCEGRLADREFPILFGVDIGHTMPMVTLPYDVLAELDSEKNSFKVIEPGVL